MTFQHNGKLIPIGLVITLIMATAGVVYQFVPRSDLSEVKLDVIRIESEYMPRAEHVVEIQAIQRRADDRHEQVIRELDEIKSILREIQAAR